MPTANVSKTEERIPVTCIVGDRSLNQLCITGY